MRRAAPPLGEFCTQGCYAERQTWIKVEQQALHGLAAQLCRGRTGTGALRGARCDSNFTRSACLPQWLRQRREPLGQLWVMLAQALGVPPIAMLHPIQVDRPAEPLVKAPW